jgi:hypothetical protein
MKNVRNELEIRAESGDSRVKDMLEEVDNREDLVAWKS